MKTKNNDAIMGNNVFLWIALATGLILLLPYMAMHFNWQVPEPGESRSSSVDWSLSDFIIMGTLIFGMSSIYVFAARQTTKYRALIGIAVALVFFLIWAELAVGVFNTPFAGS